jgi:hypothetical protein
MSQKYPYRHPGTESLFTFVHVWRTHYDTTELCSDQAKSHCGHLEVVLPSVPKERGVEGWMAMCGGASANGRLARA